MEPMSYRPLQAGDRVRFSDFIGGATGVVTRWLRDGYVQVLWSDSVGLMTHRSSHLTRVESSRGKVASLLRSPLRSELWECHKPLHRRRGVLRLTHGPG